MTHSNDNQARERLEAQIIDNVTSAVQDVILHYSPLDWQDDQCEQLQKEVLDRTHIAIATLSGGDLKAPSIVAKYVRVAETFTKILIDARRVTNPTHAILNQLGRNTTLLPQEMREDISFGCFPALEEIVGALLMNSVDATAVTESDPTSTWNDKRHARTALTNSFLLALVLTDGMKNGS
jgi:hypothetical protein